MKKPRPQEAQETEEQARLVLFEVGLTHDGTLQFFVHEDLPMPQRLMLAEALRIACDGYHDLLSYDVASGGSRDE